MLLWIAPENTLHTNIWSGWTFSRHPGTHDSRSCCNFWTTCSLSLSKTPVVSVCEATKTTHSFVLVLDFLKAARCSKKLFSGTFGAAVLMCSRSWYACINYWYRHCNSRSRWNLRSMWRKRLSTAIRDSARSDKSSVTGNRNTKRLSELRLCMPWKMSSRERSYLVRRNLSGIDSTSQNRRQLLV